jgi:hypothetical protein
MISASKKGLADIANPLSLLVPEERIELSWAQGPRDFKFPRLMSIKCLFLFGIDVIIR